MEDFQRAVGWCETAANITGSLLPEQVMPTKIIRTYPAGFPVV